MKRIFAIILVLMFVFCLVSCTPDDNGVTSTPANTLPESSEVSSSDISSETSTSSDTPSQSVPSSSNDSSSSEPSSSSPSSSDSSSTLPEGKPPFVPATDLYYNYSKLSRFQKQAYDRILAKAGEMPSHYIDLGAATDITERDAYIATVALKNDHPEIFWLPYAWYIGETHTGEMAILFVNEIGDDSGSIEDFLATYTVLRGDKQRMEAELAAAVSEIKKKVTATDPYGIELQLHDILCDKITYSKPPNPLSYTAYGALVQGDAVCEGYSRAMQLLLYEFGIRSTLVTGYAGQEHMWNLVEINGDWYHLDLTWNDQEDGIRHTYFNLTDPGISSDHMINQDLENLSKDEIISGKPFNIKLPICNATKQYYYNVTGFTYENNADELARLMASPDFVSIEIVGWRDSAQSELALALSKIGFTKGYNIKYNGSFAMIKIN